MEKSLSSETTLAVFDYDHTLITGDSFWPFLTAVAGWPRALLALAEGVGLFGLRSIQNKNDPALSDPRTFVKAHLLHRLLRGVPVEKLRPAIETTYGWQTWIDTMRQTLMDHHAQGHHIIIASGALDLYLPQLTKDLPHDALVCTKIEVIGGIITGVMTNGNCTRLRKAELVRDYIAAHGPFAESWGYGNYPHDVPMLNLLKNRIIV